MLELTTLARNLDLSTVPSTEDAAPILVCVLRKETHNQHGLCLQPIALICDVPLTSTSYAFKVWKKHCLSLFSFQGGINASHPFLPPPLKDLKISEQPDARDTHASIRWHSRQSPSSTAGRWRKEDTFHSLLRRCYACSHTPACYARSSHTRLRVHYIYTWGEERHSETGDSSKASEMDAEKGWTQGTKNNLWICLRSPFETVNWGAE